MAAAALMHQPIRFPVLVLILVVILPGAAKAEAFADLEKQHGGSRIGVAAIDFSTNRRVDHRSGERFLMCSTFKVLAAAAVLKRVDDGKEKLDRFVKYGEAQLLEYAPVTRAHVTEGGMTLEALCAAAITLSDNTAANLILETIGGPKALTELARSLGDNFTRLDHNEPELNMARPGQDDDTTTPAAMCATLQRLITSDFLTPASRAKLEGWMQQNETGLKMIRAALPTDWRAGDKTGRNSDTGFTNDIAVVRPPTGGPIFIAIYTVNPTGPQEARDQLVAEIARLVIDALKS